MWVFWLIGNANPLGAAVVVVDTAVVVVGVVVVISGVDVPGEVAAHPSANDKALTNIDSRKRAFICKDIA